MIGYLFLVLVHLCTLRVLQNIQGKWNYKIKLTLTQNFWNYVQFSYNMHFMNFRKTFYIHDFQKSFCTPINFLVPFFFWNTLVLRCATVVKMNETAQQGAYRSCRRGIIQLVWIAETHHIPQKGLSSGPGLGWHVGDEFWSLGLFCLRRLE